MFIEVEYIALLLLTSDNFVELFLSARFDVAGSLMVGAAFLAG